MNIHDQLQRHFGILDTSSAARKNLNAASAVQQTTKDYLRPLDVYNLTVRDPVANAVQDYLRPLDVYNVKTQVISATPGQKIIEEHRRSLNIQDFVKHTSMSAAQHAVEAYQKMGSRVLINNRAYDSAFLIRQALRSDIGALHDAFFKSQAPFFSWSNSANQVVESKVPRGVNKHRRKKRSLYHRK